jgi:putative PIN family toxin of toxin-antitoxin system
MAARKTRIRVVLDTNVFVRSFKARKRQNANNHVVRLWLLEKRLQLIVSEEILEEYLEIFGDVLGMEPETVAEWRLRFTSDSRTTVVSLARRFTESRDPDDNLMLATAEAGRAHYLLTNDQDLLELPEAVKNACASESSPRMTS